jgi:NAD(P)-dependent dehydrogenase (short-subunit alcohol dehydrogenase family)
MPWVSTECGAIYDGLISKPRYVSTAILGNNDPEKRAHIEKTVLPLIPMERLGDPEEVRIQFSLPSYTKLKVTKIADTILFLSSPAASYINGASLAVDGYVQNAASSAYRVSRRSD